MDRAKIVLGTVALLLTVPCLAFGQAAGATYNHDMSAYKKLAEDALKLAKDNNLPAAYAKTKDLEKVWDKGTEDFKKADLSLWTKIDDEMDVAIDATNPAKGATKAKSTAALQKWLDLLATVPAK